MRLFFKLFSLAGEGMSVEYFPWASLSLEHPRCFFLLSRREREVS